MDRMQNSKAIVTYEARILWLRMHKGVEFGINDLKEIYAFGMEKSNGAPFCILFDATSPFDISEELMEFVSTNPDNVPIKAKAYVVSKEDKTRVKHHLVFDKPLVPPVVFDTPREAINWLQTFL